MTRGLAEKDGKLLAELRGGRPFSSMLELARRTQLPVAPLVRLAKADAFRSIGLGRREASWAIKALRDDTPPLFAEADRREAAFKPEFSEPSVTLVPMTEGRKVVEDYRSHGLTLRSHPLAFLRSELEAKGIVRCCDIESAHNGVRLTVSGLVLVRQRPGSAKGVMFITLEDESGIANLIIWPSIFGQHRRAILGSQMLACRGKVQKASGVTHLIAEYLIDQSDMLRQISGMEFTLPAGRGDEARHGGSGLDPRETQALRKVRDIYVPDLHIDTLAVKARDFR
jgi:error-prone DNA polymerase